MSDLSTAMFGEAMLGGVLFGGGVGIVNGFPPGDWTQVACVEWPLAGRCVAALCDGYYAGGPAWYASVGLMNPATGRYEDWSTPTLMSPGAVGTADEPGRLVWLHDGQLLFVFVKYGGASLDAALCRELDYNGSGYWRPK